MLTKRRPANMSKQTFLNKKRLLLIAIITPIIALIGCAAVFSLVNPPSPEPKVKNPGATYNQAVNLCKAYAGASEHEQCLRAYGW